MKRLSVVIPAHDEAAVIDRLLAAVTGDARSDRLEIVVVANGCTDDTAARAAAYPGVRVVEVAAASKIAALNAADDEAAVFPRVYLDADVRIEADTLFALGEAVTREGIGVASPTLVVDASQSSWAVRQHYRIWELSSYRSAGHIGSGVYALSREGRSRFDRWPDVIADDRYVQQLFLPDERATLADHTFTVQAPRTLTAYVRRSTRIARGNQELPEGTQRAAAPSTASRAGLVRRVARRPRLWPALGIYCVTWTLPNILARRAIARGSESRWDRDETTRVTA